MKQKEKISKAKSPDTAGKRKKVEEALRKSEELYSRLIDTIPDAVIHSDLNGNIIFVNNQTLKISGYSRDELEGQNILNFILPEYHDQAINNISLMIEGKLGPFDPLVEYQMIMKNGTKCLFDVNSDVLRNEDGTPFGIVHLCRDITEYRQEEEKLRQSEVQYRLLADNITEHVWLRDINSLKIIYISPSVEKMYGYPLDEISKLPLKKLLTGESVQKMVDTFITEMPKALATLPPSVHKYSFETQAYHKDGHLLWMDNTVSFIRDKNGNLSLLLGETRDITKRKQAENELQKTLESLRKAVGTTIQVLVTALEARDPYTAGHQSQTANLARTIATEMGLSQDKIEGIRMAGAIHDIGKLSVPAEILTKPTKLTNIEFSLIKEHARSGYEMLKDVESPWPLAQIVHQHHERINGTGYPRNLKGDAILIEARILAVADVVEAMASHRPYRPSLGIESALEEIEKNKGILYDAAVADACLRLFREKSYRL